MRLLSLGMLVAACGSDGGAVVTIAAPDGPWSASRIEIVLANAKPDAMSLVDNQRVAPTSLAEEAVRYYRQRATAGAFETVDAVDGFVLRIERNQAVSPDTTFIPFLLAYDGPALIGIATVNDAQGEPGSIDILEDRVMTYGATMTPLTAVDGALGVSEGEALEVAGPSGERSGIAWRPASGLQLRLLLPDVAGDPGATDASERAPDLDLDSHAAWDSDCDDLRAAFHDDQDETCDGLDTNCDGARMEVFGCALQGGTCTGSTTGIQLCSDSGGNGQLGSCVGDAACQCANGPCVKCVLDYADAGAGQQDPCEPAIGQVMLEGCTSLAACRVDVVGTRGEWSAQIAAQQTGPYGTSLTGVHAAIFVRTKLESGGTVVGTAGGSVGEIYLAIADGANQTRLLAIDLQLQADPAACTDVGNGDSSMVCSP